MTNIEERFRKPEVQKEAPKVNKIQIPVFTNKPDSDEVGDAVTLGGYLIRL